MTIPLDLSVPPQPWMASASCASTDPDLFFPDAGGGDFVQAKKVCAACPVKLQCLEYALNEREVYGIWGGLGKNERRALRIARRRAA